MRQHCSDVQVLERWHFWQSRDFPPGRKDPQAATRCEPDAKQNHLCMLIS